MMNYIWPSMIILGAAYSIITGRLDTFTTGLLNSSGEAVTFVLGLAGIMALWSGFMKIAEESGLISILSKAVRPLISFLFPKEKNEEIISAMLMSFTANIFGAGNSATVFSIKAMEKLDAENHHRPSASNEMCMFMALSMSMLQLVPITVIKIRQDAGSAAPESIILPSIIVGFISMVASVVACRILERKY